MIIGITGGTGCGKTTTLSVIADLGGVIIDCDKVYHDLLKTDTAMLDAIESRFPGTVIDSVLDRKALAAIVFSDENALKDLNAITHGAVKKELVRRIEHTAGNVPIAIDAIGLFEGGLSELCHVTVAVTAPLEDRVKRLTARDDITEDQALQRINAQKPESYFRQHCDYVLENTGTQENFREKCLAFFQKLFTI